jgi:DNA-binding CsgD family transcriptional regulator
MKTLHATVINARNLTPKEAVVLRYICEGFGRKDIAKRRFRSEGTVAKQIEAVAEKLDCHSSAEIVATATALKMVEIRVESREPIGRQLMVMLLLMVNLSSFDIDQMRLRRTPRPVRTRCTSVRLVKLQKQL